MSEAHPLFALLTILLTDIVPRPRDDVCCGYYFLILYLGVFAAVPDVAKGGAGAKSALHEIFCFDLLELLDLPDSLDSFSSPFPLETVRFLP